MSVFYIWDSYFVTKFICARFYVTHPSNSVWHPSCVSFSSLAAAVSRATSRAVGGALGGQGRLQAPFTTCPSPESLETAPAFPLYFRGSVIYPRHGRPNCVGREGWPEGLALTSLGLPKSPHFPPSHLPCHHPTEVTDLWTRPRLDSGVTVPHDQHAGPSAQTGSEQGVSPGWPERGFPSKCTSLHALQTRVSPTGVSWGPPVSIRHGEKEHSATDISAILILPFAKMNQVSGRFLSLMVCGSFLGGGWGGSASGQGWGPWGDRDGGLRGGDGGALSLVLRLGARVLLSEPKAPVTLASPWWPKLVEVGMAALASSRSPFAEALDYILPSALCSQQQLPVVPGKRSQVALDGRLQSRCTPHGGRFCLGKAPLTGRRPPPRLRAVAAREFVPRQT